MENFADGGWIGPLGAMVWRLFFFDKFFGLSREANAGDGGHSRRYKAATKGQFLSLGVNILGEGINHVLIQRMVPCLYSV